VVDSLLHRTVGLRESYHDQALNSSVTTVPRPNPIAAAWHFVARAVRRGYRYFATRRAAVRRVVLIIILAPFLYIAGQLWHRVADAFGMRSVQQVRAFRLGQVPGVETAEFRAALAGLTETTMLPGHSVELLVNGPATLARIEQDVNAATSSVELQNYYCEPGEVAEWLKRLLVSRARAGIKVLFLRDGFGCRSLTEGYLDSLRDAGVELAMFRPLRWWHMHESMHRSHVRSITIDGRIGYVGGFGLADKWVKNTHGRMWRETSARFSGPAVAQLTGAFAVGWADATGQLLTGRRLFPPHIPPAGSTDAGVMFTRRTYGTPVPERYLALSIAGARKRIYIANSYFIPNKELRGWLIAAARRGVDVRVITPSDNVDIPLTLWAGRSTHQALLENGVRIFEYLPAMMHAKTMVIDGVFVSIGSMNLDNLSLRINDEAVLLAQDSTLAAALERSFLADLEQSREVTVDLLNHRSAYDRFMTRIAQLLRSLL
jgi:cardiolipin synthase